MSNRRRFYMDITSIRQRPNFLEFPRHFHVLFRWIFADRKIHVVSTYFFWRNFDGSKICVVSTCFFFRVISMSKNPPCFHVLFWWIFAGQNIHVFPTCFFRCNFPVQKILVVFTDFISCNFDGQKIQIVCTYFSTKFRRVKIRRCFWLSCKLMKTFEEVFLC